MILDLLRVVAGLVLLVVGSQGLVRGAVSLAGRAGVSPLLIGLTVVAFGTSTPEVAVSVESALAGQGGVALGNVVGSNVFNVLVILGLSAVITPLVVRAKLVRVDVPLMVLATLLPVLLGLDGDLDRRDGLLLLAGLAAYLVLLAVLARRERRQEGSGSYPTDGWLASVAFGLGGLALLSVGAGQLVDGGVSLARDLGVSELVIGLTIVAVGTSLPELATSVAASLRRERDLAVGNVIGSNVFNALGVLGAGAAVSGSIPVPSGIYALDFPVMVAVSVICLPVFLTGANISRTEGAVFLLYYLAYTTYLVLHATDHVLHDEFGFLVLGFVLPLTLAVGGALWIRGWRAGQGASSPAPGD